MAKKQKSIGKKFDSLKKKKEQEAIEFYKKISKYPLPNMTYTPPKKEEFSIWLSNNSEPIVSE